MACQAPHTVDSAANNDYCASCRRINIDLWTEEREVVLVKDVDKLDYSAIQCPFCQYIVTKYTKYPSIIRKPDTRWHSFFKGSSRREIRLTPCIEPVVQRDGRKLLAAIQDWNTPISSSIERLLRSKRYGHLHHSLPYRGSSQFKLLLFTNEKDAAAQMYDCITTVNDVGYSTASSHSLKKARVWISDYVNGHPRKPRQKSGSGYFRSIFKTTSSKTDIGPSRLIDCFADSETRAEDLCSEQKSCHNVSSLLANGFGKSCSLVGGSDRAEQYATLSYRWGTGNHSSWITTPGNVAARHSYLDEHCLPKTLHDAIEITRQLHIGYLWIDCICIVQNSRDDWLHESAKVGSTFSNALVTLIADSSTGSEAGIFNSKSMSSLSRLGGGDAFSNP